MARARLSCAVLRRVRHLFVNRTNLRAALVRLVNATFAARDQAWWSEGTACASDSKKFGSWSSNFMTSRRSRCETVFDQPWLVRSLGADPATEVRETRTRAAGRWIPGSGGRKITCPMVRAGALVRG
ncbi:Tn3 family transposase [Streptomyces sp. NPDC005568]|uniref:Tn3 family transposase n=1 Tax=Streptomyces sp. NPDC005568 TaxID=3156887 RepID=UPI0033BE5793